MIRQVPGPDAAFLYAERPEWHFHVSALMILDPTTSTRFSFDAVVDQIARRIHEVPQMRWKLLEGPAHLRFERPMWIDDPDFDLNRHVHRIAVPSPGDRHTLGEMVGRLVSFKLDRTRPLWELWMIEGLENDRAALLIKIHHSIIDGESGTELATLLYDLEPDPEPGPEPPAYEPEPQPAMVDRLLRGATNAALWPVRAGRLTRQLVRQGMTMGRHLLSEAEVAAPLTAPRTSFNGQLTPDRLCATAAVSLADVKRVKNAFGVTINDVVLALSGGALLQYLDQRGEIPDRPLIAQVPVSIRGDANRDAVGTQVAAMFCSLATDIADPAERLQAISASSSSGKQMRNELSEQREMSAADTFPPAAVAIMARTWSLAGLDAKSPPVFNVIVSNVPGPPFDLFVAGARIESLYPMGPLMLGSGVNFSVVSDATTLDFGLMACPALVPDPWPIADAIPKALADLIDAANAMDTPQ